jgi:hypothetical protein
LNGTVKMPGQLSPPSATDGGIEKPAADSMLSTMNSPSVMAIKGDPTKPTGIQPPLVGLS